MFNLLTVLSALLCVAVATLSLTSRDRRLAKAFTVGGRPMEFVADDGWIELIRIRAETVGFSVRGEDGAHETEFVSLGRFTSRTAGVPAWPGVVVTLALPAAWLMVEHRRRRARTRARSGLCVACGYDLRASTGRCPECGTTSPT